MSSACEQFLTMQHCKKLMISITPVHRYVMVKGDQTNLLDSELVNCFFHISVDGSYCLTCGADKSVKLWNPHLGTMIKSYTGHGYEVLDAHSSIDNAQFCSCSLDKAVLLWDVATGKILRKYRGHVGMCVRV